VRHKADRAAAKESIETATAQREKEAEAFAEESARDPRLWPTFPVPIIGLSRLRSRCTDEVLHFMCG